MLRVQDSVAQSQCLEQFISLLVTTEIWRLVSSSLDSDRLRKESNLRKTFRKQSVRSQVIRIISYQTVRALHILPWLSPPPSGAYPSWPLSLSFLSVTSIHVHHSTDTGRATHHPALPFFISFMIQPRSCHHIITRPRVLLMTTHDGTNIQFAPFGPR